MNHGNSKRRIGASYIGIFSPNVKRFGQGCPTRIGGEIDFIVGGVIGTFRRMYGESMEFINWCYYQEMGLFTVLVEAELLECVYSVLLIMSWD